MNKEYLICYSFTFNVCIRSKKGKIYKAHIIAAVGISYELAHWDMETKLKRRGIQIEKVNHVTVDRIEFALDEGVPIQLNLSEYMPIMPEHLNK